MAEARGKRVLLVIAPENFRDEELFDTQAELRASGAETVIASSATGTVKGSLGATAEPRLLLSDAKASDFDAVVFIGGAGASAYFGSPAAHNLARQAYEAGKPVAAICIAPSILANAGLLRGKKATAYPSERKNLEEKGATFTGEKVTVDGKIITASGPSAAREFGKKIAGLLE